MKDIKSRLIAIARLDCNRFADDGRFDKACDLGILIGYYQDNEKDRPTFLKEYAEILERD